MIEQAVRRALLRLSSSHVLSEDAHLELSHLLRILLPTIPKHLVKSFATPILDAALSFKMAAMAEPAMYRPFWIKHRQKYDDHRMRIPGDAMLDGDILCLIPGLETQHDQITLLKAFVMLL